MQGYLLQPRSEKPENRWTGSEYKSSSRTSFAKTINSSQEEKNAFSSKQVRDFEKSKMHSLKFLCLFLLSTVYCLPVENSESGVEFKPSKIISSLRDKRSPVPDPHHHHSKLHAHVHIHGHYDQPAYYVKPVVQPVYVKPVAVVAQPVVAQPVATGCSVCGGGGGYGGSHSQASSQASSSSFSAGLNSPFGNLGFSSSAAQASAQAGSAGYGK